VSVCRYVCVSPLIALEPTGCGVSVEPTSEVCSYATLVLPILGVEGKIILKRYEGKWSGGCELDSSGSG
jgi:hypothetical protein